jgi:hypothetical protein
MDTHFSFSSHRGIISHWRWFSLLQRSNHGRGETGPASERVTRRENSSDSFALPAVLAPQARTTVSSNPSSRYGYHVSGVLGVVGPEVEAVNEMCPLRDAQRHGTIQVFTSRARRTRHVQPVLHVCLVIINSVWRTIANRQSQKGHLCIY